MATQRFHVLASWVSALLSMDTSTHRLEPAWILRGLSGCV
jgi:hypothetical protein